MQVSKTKGVNRVDPFGLLQRTMKHFDRYGQAGQPAIDPNREKFGRGLPDDVVGVARYRWCGGDRGGLAPRGIQALLDVEEPRPKRAPHDRDGTARAD